MINLKNVPEIGNEYYFFDDGKISPSRCYKAKVLRIIPAHEKIMVDKWDYDLETTIPTDIRDIYKTEVNDHRQSENFHVLSKYAPNVGDPWLYAEETDFFIECEIPEYDKNNIWFVSTIAGGWFSLSIQSSWQCGDLDVDFSKYEYAKKTFDDMNWDGYYDYALTENNALIVQ